MFQIDLRILSLESSEIALSIHFPDVIVQNCQLKGSCVTHNFHKIGSFQLVAFGHRGKRGVDFFRHVIVPKKRPWRHHHIDIGVFGSTPASFMLLATTFSRGAGGVTPWGERGGCCKTAASCMVCCPGATACISDELHGPWLFGTWRGWFILITQLTISY